MRHTATHCNALDLGVRRAFNTLQQHATHCNNMRYTATHCNALDLGVRCDFNSHLEVRSLVNIRVADAIRVPQHGNVGVFHHILI